jgi:hypothetical protein
VSFVSVICFESLLASLTRAFVHILYVVLLNQPNTQVFKCACEIIFPVMYKDIWAEIG